jgi:hypothetical protein
VLSACVAAGPGASAARGNLADGGPSEDGSVGSRAPTRKSHGPFSTVKIFKFKISVSNGP